MNITFVHIHVKPEFVDHFIQATSINVQNSIKEEGAVRFDFFQQADDPSRFVLIEIYRSAEDAARHKETAHYKTWRDAVGTWMAEPRAGTKYKNILPSDDEWV